MPAPTSLRRSRNTQPALLLRSDLYFVSFFSCIVISTKPLLKMSPSLMDCPPELLINVLNFLPVQALLRFGQTSQYNRHLAQSSLHTLSLGIHQNRMSAAICKLAATQYPELKHIKSVFEPSYQSSAPTRKSWSSRRSSVGSDYFPEDDLEKDPYGVSVLISDAEVYDYSTLINFNAALTKSILTRHGGTLRNLDLSMCTLTTPIAGALARLSALRVLSIRIEDSPHMRTIPRSRMSSQRAEQRRAWDILSDMATWGPRLEALRIEGGEVSTSQLSQLLARSRWCRELWLSKCNFIGEELWEWLGSEWQGSASLRILGVMRCGGQIGDLALDVIGGLSNLQVSTFGCDTAAWGATC
ncbi:hypothetical protein DM02DRAFT_423781 [Periconia macrospinosa]|uniref:F-box domain-containing protein n=1 Tax=Periconia macrospinosa TaxID=97972 RepID=A0A2V1E8N5_9PLEO|nr:hypothetical protein DM02DRAFT_423781 [Periconia macrospinosa]